MTLKEHDQFEIDFFFNTIRNSEEEQKICNEQAKNLEGKILEYFKSNPAIELTPLQIKDAIERIWGNVHESSVRRACHNLCSEKWSKSLIGTGNQKLERYGKPNELLKLNIH